MGENLSLLEKSIEVILKNQSRYGSYIASPRFRQYRYCWIRDGSFIAYAMDISDNHQSSLRFHKWVFKVLKRYSWKLNKLFEKYFKNELRAPNDYLHTRYTLQGSESKSSWPNKQFDGYGIWLWSLSEHIKSSGNEYLIDYYFNELKLVIKYLTIVWKEPCYDCWEENPDKIHTSTLASIAGGLKSISRYVRDDILQYRKAIDEIVSFITRKNTIDKRFAKYYDPKIGRASGIDASLLWLVYPFKLFSEDSLMFKNTVKSIEEKLLENSGGVHRYPEDTYYGGGEWIILAAWLAWHYANIGKRDKAYKLLEWIESTADDNGYLPEQVTDNMLAPQFYTYWFKKWGPIAKPLIWSHAMYIILRNFLEG
ncbi:MAG: hypothetical protein J7K82_01340 [Thermoproteales archaeon]|nr:hypothetical protein [Thermoproteales archaeon]